MEGTVVHFPLVTPAIWQLQGMWERSAPYMLSSQAGSAEADGVQQLLLCLQQGCLLELHVPHCLADPAVIPANLWSSEDIW
jgi:hypothetical protein